MAADDLPRQAIIAVASRATKIAKAALSLAGALMDKLGDYRFLTPQKGCA